MPVPGVHPRVEAALNLAAVWLDARRDFVGLPGVSAGVVLGDELLWSSGFGLGVQHGKAAELSTACAARGRGAPRGGGAWLAARVQTGEKRGRNGGLSTP